MKTRYAVPTTLALVLSALVADTAQAQITVEAQVGTAVVDRMVQGSGTQFAPSVGQLYTWSRVTGAAGTTIQHVWIHGPHESTVPLQIGGSPWRTWSSKIVPAEWTGPWRVEIRDASGNVLQTLNFTVS